MCEQRVRKIFPQREAENIWNLEVVDGVCEHYAWYQKFIGNHFGLPLDQLFPFSGAKKKLVWLRCGYCEKKIEGRSCEAKQAELSTALEQLGACKPPSGIQGRAPESLNLHIFPSQNWLNLTDRSLASASIIDCNWIIFILKLFFCLLKTDPSMAEESDPVPRPCRMNGLDGTKKYFPSVTNHVWHNIQIAGKMK